MAKITFASLKLKTSSETKEVTIGEHQIEVKQYLPASDKADLIQIALQKAEENGIYNEVLLEVYFNLNLIYLYTNITFTDKQKEDELKLYDILESNGVVDQVIAVIPNNEYNALREYMDDMKFNMLNYKNTAGAVLQSVIQDLPKNAAAAKEIVDSFDKTKFQEVINFATAANGGRNINTNEVVKFPSVEEDK